MDATELIHLEARLLDQYRYCDWLDLFTDDVRYWAPASHDATAPDGVVNHIYDDRQRMEDRVFRLTEKHAHAQAPPSRTCRVLTDLHEESPSALWNGAPPCDLVIGATFTIAALRAGEQQVLFGWSTHGIRSTGAGPLIAVKKVVLLTCEEPVRNLSFPL